LAPSAGRSPIGQDQPHQAGSPQRIEAHAPAEEHLGGIRITFHVLDDNFRHVQGWAQSLGCNLSEELEHRLEGATCAECMGGGIK
jgi:hypothetical protein